MKLKHLYLCCSLFLVACGGGSDGDDDQSGLLTDPDAAINITSFDIVGTSADLGPGLAPINPLQNSGEFEINWSIFNLPLVNSSNINYTTSIYVSEDDTGSDLSSSGDILIFRDTCNATNTCITVECSYSTSNIMSCGAFGAVDITAFLDVLPKDAYIAIETCNLADTICYSTGHRAFIQ